MGYFIQPILTDKASSETALAIQNREPLVFTRIALGSGRHRTDIGKKNNVVQVVHSLQVAQSLSTDVADTIRLTARFDNSQIDREIIVNEIGVFAKRGNHEEFMYMYTWAEQGDVIPPKTSAYVYRDYDFNTTISKNSQIIDVGLQLSFCHLQFGDSCINQVSRIVLNGNLTILTNSRVEIMISIYISRRFRRNHIPLFGPSVHVHELFMIPTFCKHTDFVHDHFALNM